jgi:hypothetical protein
VPATRPGPARRQLPDGAACSVCVSGSTSDHLLAWRRLGCTDEALRAAARGRDVGERGAAAPRAADATPSLVAVVRRQMELLELPIVALLSPATDRRGAASIRPAHRSYTDEELHAALARPGSIGGYGGALYEALGSLERWPGTHAAGSDDHAEQLGLCRYPTSWSRPGPRPSSGGSSPYPEDPFRARCRRVGSPWRKPSSRWATPSYRMRTYRIERSRSLEVYVRHRSQPSTSPPSPVGPDGGTPGGVSDAAVLRPKNSIRVPALAIKATAARRVASRLACSRSAGAAEWDGEADPARGGPHQRRPHGQPKRINLRLLSTRAATPSRPPTEDATSVAEDSVTPTDLPG